MKKGIIIIGILAIIVVAYFLMRKPKKEGNFSAQNPDKSTGHWDTATGKALPPSKQDRDAPNYLSSPPKIQDRDAPNYTR